MKIDRFHGNDEVAATLQGMVDRDRIPQTILLSGPEGIGKATLARRFASALLGDTAKIERDDLSLPDNAALIIDREKWTAEKRSDDPLLFSTHPDFLTFVPDGPLRQLTVQQMRALRERAPFKPLKGRYRVFLIDRLDRANEQAANSLLKTLEEPPEHLILLLTAQNPYDLLPTIRSRSILLEMTPLSPEAMSGFAREKGIVPGDRRLALAAGSPGQVLSVDLETYDKRRAAMLQLLSVASGQTPFADWPRIAESVSAGRSDKLDSYLEILYILLGDVLSLHFGQDRIRNPDIRRELQSLARKTDYEWIRKAVGKIDELVEFTRRNIQKGIALDGMIAELRPRGV